MPEKVLFLRKVPFPDENSRFSWNSRAAHFRAIQGALAYVRCGAVKTASAGVISGTEMSSFFHFFCVQKSGKSMSFLMYKKGCIVATFRKLQQNAVLGPPKGDPKPPMLPPVFGPGPDRKPHVLPGQQAFSELCSEKASFFGFFRKKCEKLRI